jgi:hypothetical protein
MTLAVELSQVQLVLSQIILPDVISVAVISTAAGSDISVMTSSIHSFPTELDSKTGMATTNPQSVIVPLSIKVASANALLIEFRDQKQLSDCRTDCFGRIAIGMRHDGSGATAQLRIGNDVIPYAAISTPQELYHHLARSMHEFGDKEYATMFMKCHAGQYITNETHAVVIDSTADSMYTQNDFSHPLLQYPLPGCVTYRSKKLTGSALGACTMDEGGIVPFKAWMGTNRAHPNREPYFYSTCLVGFDLDAFEGASRRIRSGRYLGDNSVFLHINSSNFNNIDMANATRSVNVIVCCLHDSRISFQAGGRVQCFY